MTKAILNISIDREVAKSLEAQWTKENEARGAKLKSAINKSEYIQSLIVIGLIIRTNKRENIPKILADYFEDETGESETK
jgi:hypothetical protein